MHAPSTPATGAFPMLRPSLLLLQHRDDPMAGGGLGAEGRLGAGPGLRAREKPGLAKGYLVPVFAVSGSAKLSSLVGFNPQQGELGDSPTVQACLCENPSLGSSGKFSPPP